MKSNNFVNIRCAFEQLLPSIVVFDNRERSAVENRSFCHVSARETDFLAHVRSIEPTLYTFFAQERKKGVNSTTTVFSFANI